MQSHHRRITGSERRERFKDKLLSCGISEICFGLSTVALGVTTIFVPNDNWRSVPNTFTNSSQGIWAGSAICISGLFGIVGNRKPTVSLYKRNLYASVISAIIAGTGFILTIIAMTTTWGALVGVHSGILLTLLGGTVTCIVHSAYCCAGVCTRRSKPREAVVRISRPGHGNEQIIRLPPGEYIVVHRTEATGSRTDSRSLHRISYPDSRPQTVSNPALTGLHIGTSFSHDVGPPGYNDCRDCPPSYESLQK